MKNLLSAFTITAAITALALGGCTRTNQAPSPQIIGQWTMSAAIGKYTNYGVVTNDTTWFTSADYFNFKADSTLSIMEGGNAYNGRWEIVNQRLMISGTNYMDFAGGFALPILTAHNLQLLDTASTANTDLEQKLNLTR